MVPLSLPNSLNILALNRNSHMHYAGKARKSAGDVRADSASSPAAVRGARLHPGPHAAHSAEVRAVRGEATLNLWRWLARALDIQPKWLPHPKGTGGAQQCFLLVNFYLLACWPGWHLIAD